MDDCADCIDSSPLGRSLLAASIPLQSIDGCLHESNAGQAEEETEAPPGGRLRESDLDTKNKRARREYASLSRIRV